MSNAAFDPGTPTSGFLSPPDSAEIIWVSRNGDDTTGDGSFVHPFLTINRACTQVRTNGDASNTNRYTIFVGPGIFTEDLVMSDWTWVIGSSQRSARIVFNSFAFGAEFAAAGSHQCGFEQITFQSAVTFDYTTLPSAQGSLNLTNVWSNPYAINTVGNTSSNQFQFAGCFLGSLNQTGGYLIAFSSTFGGAITLNSNAVNVLFATLMASPSQSTILAKDNGGGVSLKLLDSALAGMLTLDGANASVHTQSTPIAFRNGVTLLNGALEPRFVLTGAKAGNVALASVCTELANSGAFLDSTT